MRWALLLAVAALATACATPLEDGERLYREGDRLGALAVWRGVPESDRHYQSVRERIAVVEAEFGQLVVQHLKRGRYYEDRGRLAESILDYRLALELEPEDRKTLDHVQDLARELARQKAERNRAYRAALDASDLPEARRQLVALRVLDPFDPELETGERSLKAALDQEIERRMAAGRLGFASGNYAAASRAFLAALDLDPDNESARGYLSYIATILRENAAAGRAPAAFAPPQTVASDNQIRAEGMYQNALAAERAGDPYTAIRQDQRALQADPTHRAAQQHLAALRHRLAPDVEGLIEAGRTAFRAEDLQSALDLWRQAQLVDPRNERVAAYIGRAVQQIQNLERLRATPPVSSGGRGR